MDYLKNTPNNNSPLIVDEVADSIWKYRVLYYQTTVVDNCILYFDRNMRLIGLVGKICK